MQSLVLIDTWWNVNIIYRLASLRMILVLIDTWWNVNEESVISLVVTSEF